MSKMTTYKTTFAQDVLINRDLTINRNCTVGVGGIYSGNGSGLTNLNLGTLSATAGKYILADPTTGVLEASTTLSQDVSQNVALTNSGTFIVTSGGQTQIAAPSIDLNSSIINCKNFIGVDQTSKIIINAVPTITTNDAATTTTLFQYACPALSSTLVRFGISAYNKTAGTSSATSEGSFKVLMGALGTSPTISSIAEGTNIVDAALATVLVSTNSITNNYQITVNGVAATQIIWSAFITQTISQ